MLFLKNQGNNLLCNVEANAAFSSVEVYDFPIHPSSLSTQFKPLISAVFTLAPNATWVNKTEL